MKTGKHYFSLRCKGSNAYHTDGQRFRMTDPVVNIGETADCDIRYDSHGMQPERYASIVRNADGRSWRIVRRSPFADISITGKGPIGYAAPLSDGDLLQVGEQPMTLVFHQHREGDRPAEALWRWAVVALLAVATATMVLLHTGRHPEAIATADVEPLEESLFLIRVDSVCRAMESGGQLTMIPPMKLLDGETPTGTAFLTTDGRIVTARHCVEYWIGSDLDLTTRVTSLSQDNIVRWAIEAETFNQQCNGDSAMRLRVFFSLYDSTGNRRHTLSSTDSRVHTNTDRDGIYMLADFTRDYYWRSVRPYFTDRQMELGDILWIDSIGESGKVALATADDMRHVRNGTPLMVCGYPLTGIGDKKMTATQGTISRRPAATAENLFFEANINHGFSGGPVLVKGEGGVVAIGVVSRVDSVSSGLYKWAVPVTEIAREE